MQGYYQNAYMYPNYQQYYSTGEYGNYYNLQQQLIYDPHYYQQYYQQPAQTDTYPYSSPQELVNNNRYTGRLKFYDSNGKYGFIILDGIGSDLFVHFDDLSKAGMTKELLETHSASR